MYSLHTFADMWYKIPTPRKVLGNSPALSVTRIQTIIVGEHGPQISGRHDFPG